MKSTISDANRVGYVICVTLFSFWMTISILEPLWPGAAARPMALPMYWLFLSMGSILHMHYMIGRAFRSRKYLILALLVILGIMPIIFGYIGLLAQMYSIGFELAE